MTKNKVGKAYKETKKGTGKVARFVNKEGKSYFKSAKKTLGFNAKGKLNKKERKDIVKQVLNSPFKGMKALDFAHILSIDKLGKKKK